MIKTLLRHLPWWGPLLLFILLTPISEQVDMKLASHFYGPQGFIKQTDHQHPMYSVLYTYGELPGQAVGAGALVLLILTAVFPSLLPFRKAALVITITAFVGAVLLVNGIFKEFWGRPRPKQLVEFGGTEAFRPFYSPIRDKSHEFKSFPSGHAAMGFLFLSFGLIGWYERKRGLCFTGMAVGLILGSVLAYVRMAQGGHFLTDVFASGLLMWLLALVSCRFVYRT